MDKSFYNKVTGDKITGKRWALCILRLTYNLKLKSIFMFFYTNFTEEGKRWKNILRLSQQAEQAVTALIRGNDTLKRFDRQMRALPISGAEQKTWWTLFEIMEDYQVAYMIQDFLSNDAPDDLEAFAAVCTDLADQIQALVVVSETHGAVLTEPEYIRAVALQQLATCFSTFPLSRRTEEQIRQLLKSY